MLGKRKFIVVMVVILGCFVCLPFKWMSDSVAAQLIGAALLFYVGGNVAAKWSPSGSEKGGS